MNCNKNENAAQTAYRKTYLSRLSIRKKEGEERNAKRQRISNTKCNKFIVKKKKKKKKLERKNAIIIACVKCEPKNRFMQEFKYT